MEKPDRYALYGMIGSRVRFPKPGRKGRVVEGVLEDVSRDVFARTVLLRIEGGKEHALKEPDAMRTARRWPDGRPAAVVLEYGTRKGKGMTAKAEDEETWKTAREQAFRQDLGEALESSERHEMKTVTVEAVGDGRKARRRRRT
jgi:hypothetical protein